MNDITNRNYDIAAARLAGEKVSSLAEKYGLHANSIGRIAQENAIYVERRNDRPLPLGLTARAAVVIEDALGIWPTDADIPYIAGRWYQILRFPNRRGVIADIREWLGISR